MPMTHEEASRKKCPHRIYKEDVMKGSVLRWQPCITTDCMMWKPYSKEKGDCGLKS